MILRIIHRRLLLAAALTDHKLILECYHPSSKNTEPYLFCDYLGTPGLSSEKDGEGTAYENSQSIGRLGILGGLYSRFRPIRPEAERRLFRPHPAGNPTGQQGAGASSPEMLPEIEGQPEALVAHTVNLDSHELFSQLMVVTNLVRLGPRRGVFYSFVNIADGVVRIWREWLAERARSNKAETSSGNELDEDIIKEAPSAGNVENNDRASRTLWVGNRKDVGVRVRIQERTWRRNAPILLLRDEDPAVSYSMEYEGRYIRAPLEWKILVKTAYNGRKMLMEILVQNF